MLGTNGELNSVLAWVRTNGGRTMFNRLRIKILPQTVREGVVLDEVNAETTCSEAYLEAVRKAASDLLGQPCPY